MRKRSPEHVALGGAMRELRLGLGLSQQGLALRSRMHRTYVAGIERGERNVSFANLIRIADALEVSLLGLAKVYERHLKSPKAKATTRAPARRTAKAR